ncbi:RICIN domain-containing protein [Streptomyces griseorubiginosus]|uniref:RICIN domain-containing protein n=1 Tax=Streptomyces griseorubiginosus TaxID=67304 RepID=UPI00362B4802
MDTEPGGGQRLHTQQRQEQPCLDVPSKSIAENVQPQQWTCNGAANQQFAADLVRSLTGSKSMLVNINSGLNIGVDSSSTTAGAAAVQPTGAGATSQQWNLL